MFLEQPRHVNKRRGWIEVICGSMFSGKTEELIRRLKRARIARQEVKIFKPEADNRYHTEKVVSHDDNQLLSTPVPSSKAIIELAGHADVVGVDEAQFFDMDLVNVCNSLADQGIRVVVAGLDMDYTGMPFGPVPALLATAEYVTKVHAICIRCGHLANHSHRIAGGQGLVVLGEKSHYEPLCRDCFRSTNSYS
jgi:thymidine kinase